MTLILKIFKKYFLISSLCGMVLIFCIIGGNYYYQVTKTDLLLVKELDALVKSQTNRTIQIPLGWDLVKQKDSIDKEGAIIISYPIGSFLDRQIFFYHSLDGVNFCLTKTQELVWSQFDVYIVVFSSFGVFLLFFLMYFVLKMYIFSVIWKMLVSLNSELQNDKSLPIKIWDKTNKNINIFLDIPQLKKAYIDEFSSILKPIQNQFNQLLEQKKVPENYIQELQYFLNESKIGN